MGNAEYIEALQKQLGIKAKGREITRVEGAWQLRETETAYRGRFEGQKGGLSSENTLFWTDLSIRQCLSLVRPNFLLNRGGRGVRSPADRL